MILISLKSWIKNESIFNYGDIMILVDFDGLFLVGFNFDDLKMMRKNVFKSVQMSDLSAFAFFLRNICYKLLWSASIESELDNLFKKNTLKHEYSELQTRFSSNRSKHLTWESKTWGKSKNNILHRVPISCKISYIYNFRKYNQILHLQSVLSVHTDWIWYKNIIERSNKLFSLS